MVNALPHAFRPGINTVAERDVVHATDVSPDPLSGDAGEADGSPPCGFK